MTVKKKLRLKKKVLYIGIFLIVAISLSTYFGTKFYKEYKYKQTTEYKLIEHGYAKEEAIKLLEAFTTEEEIQHIFDMKKNPKILELINQKYYKKKNLDRYLAYAEKNKNLANEEIIALINVNRDYDYYEHPINSDVEKGVTLNVNKYYTLQEDYEPENLVKISTRYAYDGNKIIAEANDNFVALCKVANDAGFTLIVNSSYRSFNSQLDVYNKIKNSKGYREADRVAARPGNSEHQTGLAIDVFEKNNQSTATFKDSPAYSWLQDNAYKFGFIERYPENKENITGYSPEAWHWRYVGEEAARIIYEENITFDEYYAYYIEQ